jgi:hyperosmotically inducible protein
MWGAGRKENAMIQGKTRFCAGVLVVLALVTAGCMTAEKRSAGRVIDDATITAQVKTKLATDERVKAYQVDVDTHSGVVTLTGTVDTQLARTAATQIAGSVSGVQSVNNLLSVKSTG